MYACQVSPSVSRDQHTALPLVGVLVTWYGRIYYIINIYIKNEKLSNSNYNRRKPKFLRLLWDIIIFRLVAYLLNVICLNLLLLYNIVLYEFSYNFDTVLFPSLETGTSDRCLICMVQLLRFSGFILYPLSFILYIPFK